MIAARAYEPIHTPCELSSCSVQEAASILYTKHNVHDVIYELHVSSRQLYEARILLRSMAASVQDNPLAPYINLEEDSSLAPREWFLECGGRRVGSTGVDW